jgi:hypothetical protein
MISPGCTSDARNLSASGNLFRARRHPRRGGFVMTVS